MATTIAATRTSTSKIANDTHARDAFLALAERSDAGTWLVQFDFTRVAPGGRQLRQNETEANRPPVHVTANSTTVTVDFGTRVVSCTSTAEGPRCLPEQTGRTLPPAAVYHVVTRLGGYRVEPAPARTIAGERARCFRLTATRASLADLGTDAERCYATDG